MIPVSRFAGLIFFLFSLLQPYSYAQNKTPQVTYSADSSTQQRAGIRLLFYNVENLFDTIDDPLTEDNDFLPRGKMHWTGYRYYEKINHLYQAIVAAGGWSPPEMIGFCEIENDFVLKGLIHYTPLSGFDYRYVHCESSDVRGIDVAFLYRKDFFTVLNYQALRIDLPSVQKKKTRDILYIKGVIRSEDTLHIFINHWPSRREGTKLSEPYRIAAARILRKCADSIFSKQSAAKIIITGDFNDEADDKSLSNILKAQTNLTGFQEGKLYNLASGYLLEHSIGSLKYQGKWNLFDQMIVSGSLLLEKKYCVTPDSFHVFCPAFLLQKDKDIGTKPFRTYLGYKYTGGFSDHLPVYIDLK